MSTSGQPTRNKPTKGRATRSRRQARNDARQPTQAELQAMEARSRATVSLADDVVVVEEQPAPRQRQAGSRAAQRQRKPVVRATLTKAQEYAYIRSDLRRLIVTAGPLLVLMIALLFVIDR